MSPLDAAGRAEVERVFAADAPLRLERLAGALEGLARGEDTLPAARFEAHALRGAAAIVGREDLATLCRSIEELLADGEPDAGELRAAARRVRAARPAPGAPLLPGARLARRLVPHRFMSQLAAILLLTIVPAFGIAVYDAYHGRQAARATVGREATGEAVLTAQALQQLIAGGRRVLVALSLSPEVVSGDPRSCTQAVTRYAARLSPYSHFAVTAPDGVVVCSSATPSRTSAAVSRSLFKTIRATGAFAVGPLHRDPVGGHWIISIGQPLGPGGRPGAQIGAVIPASAVQALIERAILPRRSSMTVFDRYGDVLARRPDPAGSIGAKVGLARIHRLAPAAGAAETRAPDGIRRVYAADAAGPWSVSVGIASGAADSTLTRELVYELLLIGGLGLLGLALGLAGARRALGRPLEALVATAGRLRGGDLSARAGVDPRGGELGELAESLDAMAAALERQVSAGVRAATRVADELETRVGDRTAELELARAQAEQASRAKTAFLSRLSHELRTPLNAIGGFSQILGAVGLEPDQAEAAAHIAAGADHMTRLVEELLDMARIEAGEFRLELEPTSLGAVVHEVIDLSRGLAESHGVAISTSEVDAGLGVLADRGRLRQALLNLFTNAIVYNRRGGTVSVRGSRRPDGRVVVDVLDTGVGIAADDLARVFVPYDRLGRGPESDGLGLGLALSQRLVAAMGGTIEIASEVGVGTRFTIALREAELLRDAADPEWAPNPTPRRGTRRVLYIEDNATSMKLVELLLRGRGVEFQGASTAAEGIAAARADAPDLILLDLQLPDGSGEDVLLTLRAEPALRAVPIVMLSAQASRDTIRRLLEAGADDYLTKPIEVDRAANLIERHLRRDTT